MASDRLARALAVDVPLLWRSAKRFLGGPSADPGDEPDQPAVGCTRIHGELLKLGIEIAQSTVAKYLARSGRGLLQTRKTFRRNHVARIAAVGLLVVPAIGFRLLFVLVILRHDRHRLPDRQVPFSQLMYE